MVPNYVNFITSLLKIKGVHFFYLKKIQAYLGLSLFKNKKKNFLKNLTFFKEVLVIFINFYNHKFIALKSKIFFFFRLLKEINHYKGKRLIFSLPLNGQRTHTNAQTIKKLLSQNIKKKKKIIIFYIYYLIYGYLKIDLRI